MSDVLRDALQDYMAAFGQGLEAHGIAFGQQQKDADAKARAALAERQSGERLQRLKDAIEGECAGLAIDDAHALAILQYVDEIQPAKPAG
jgi:hypothetical protein